jgi:hypothetical protein
MKESELLGKFTMKWGERQRPTGDLLGALHRIRDEIDAAIDTLTAHGVVSTDGGSILSESGPPVR